MLGSERHSVGVTHYGSPKTYFMYYVQLSTGLIVRSKSPFSFDSNGWSINIDLETKLSNVDDNPNVGFYTTVNFSFKRDAAVAYWGC